MASEIITPRKVQSVVKAGFLRMKTYRRARAMFVKEYVGQYYRKEFGITGEEPLNLLFGAIRSIVPHIINQSPKCEVTSDYGPEYDQYADLLSLGIDKVNIDMQIKDILRAGAVAAMFAMGIAKVGLSSSGSLVNVNNQNIDPGKIYISMVDLDDFVIDPVCRALNESMFFGHRILIPRQELLTSDLYDHDLVQKLASVNTMGRQKRTSDISAEYSGDYKLNELQDIVSVVELYFPKADAIATIPDPYMSQTFDKYLMTGDYYGPKRGPYSFLSLTPPVEGNPLPVAPVSLYFDLHRAANRMANKMVEQGDGQKDILLAKPTHTDVANDIATSPTGSVITTDDPKAVNLVSFGGVTKDNASMSGQIHQWFNYMAGSPDQLAGMSGGAESATESASMTNNSAISVEDAKGLIYDWTADIDGKVAWYLHTDPLIDMMLAKRKVGGEKIHLRLTPEQRVGDWQNFYFKIRPKSMGKLNPMVRAKRLTEFLTKIVPAILQSAMIATNLGIEFNPNTAITLAAEGLDIGTDVADIMADPMFQQKMAFRMMMGPQPTGKAGGGGMGDMAGMMQNGQSPTLPKVNTNEQDFNMEAQEGANDSQSQNFGAF